MPIILTAESDYIAATGTLTFSHLETSKNVSVTVDGDENNEADENFFLNLSNAVNASLSGFTAVTVIKNYTPPPSRAPLFDFDGDGKADLAVYRPSIGYWYVLNSTNNQFSSAQFGILTNKPVAADYDGDGKTDQAVYRAETGTWYLFQSTKGFGSIQFGLSTDLPAPADYDGDGKTDVAVFRMESGNWYQMKSTKVQFGSNGDKPTANAFIR